MNIFKLAFVGLVILININLSAQNDNTMKTIYDYTVTDVFGTDYPLSELKGDKVMIVNTASECGLTPQYTQLQELYDKYSNDNFTIIGNSLYIVFNFSLLYNIRNSPHIHIIFGIK